MIRALSLLLAASALWAQGGADIDPDAIAALNKMGAHLRSLKVFQVRSSISTEDVLDDGQKLQSDSSLDMLVSTPDGLRIEVNGDMKHRLYLFDGKQFTLFGRLLNYYATAPAPPTISQLVQDLREKYGIETPMGDLFTWGTERSHVGDIKSAMDVGPSEVDGTTCEQYAFRQEGLDWQIWIQKGDFPLPRKLVITTLTDEARPQYVSVMRWNVQPSFNDAAFTFEAPADAHRIVFAQMKKEEK